MLLFSVCLFLCGFAANLYTKADFAADSIVVSLIPRTYTPSPTALALALALALAQAHAHVHPRTDAQTTRTICTQLSFFKGMDAVDWDSLLLGGMSFNFFLLVWYGSNQLDDPRRHDFTNYATIATRSPPCTLPSRPSGLT